MNPTKNQGELMCSRRVSSSCSDYEVTRGTSVAGTVYHSRAPEFTPPPPPPLVSSVVCVAQSLVFRVYLCRSMTSAKYTILHL